MAKVQFYKCLRQQYLGLASVNPDALYFLTDSNQIYLGDRNVTECLIFVESWSEITDLPILGKFYLNTTTGEFKCCDANGLRTLIPPVISTAAEFDDVSKADYLASVAAIKEYVLHEIQEHTSGVSDVQFDDAEGNIEVVKDGVLEHVPLTGVAHSPTYQDLVITIPVYGSEDLVIDIPKDTFVRSGRYEDDYPLPNPPGGHGPAIVLVVGDGEHETEVVVPAASLVQIYSGGTTDTLTVSVDSSTNTITGQVRLSPDASNILISTQNGLTADGSAFAIKNTSIPANQVILSDGQGGFLASGAVINTQSLGTNDLATGKVIADAITAAITGAIGNLGDRVSALEDKLDTVVDDEIVIGQNDRYVSSGVTIGQGTLSQNPTANVVATELAVSTALANVKMSWEDIEYDPHPGYTRFDVFANLWGQNPITQNYITNQAIAEEYPPVNAIDGDPRTVWYPACTDGRQSCLSATVDGLWAGWYIIEADYVLGSGGLAACANAETSGSLERVGGGAQVYGVNGAHLAQEILDSPIHKVTVVSEPLKLNMVMSMVTIRIQNPASKQFGLGISDVRVYYKPFEE